MNGPINYEARPECLIEGCTKRAFNLAKGWCSMHYARWQRHGDTATVYRRHDPGGPVERFWAKVVIGEHADDCWGWLGTIDGRGYAHLRVGTGPVLAHRFAYRLIVGSLDDDLTLDHECHNRDLECLGGVCAHRACTNPGHLVETDIWTNTRNGRSPSAINAKKSHCIRDHPFDESNTYWASDGSRACRACHRAHQQRWLSARTS